MQSKLKKAAAGIFLLALMAFACQCTSWFLSTTHRTTFYVKECIYAVEDSVDRAEVNLLEENQDWKEHHDEIKSINRVLFTLWVRNKSEIDATAQLYISTDCALSTAQEVRERAILILHGISVPANDSTYVTARESHKYLQNWDLLEDRLIEGQFCIYCIAESPPFEIEVPDSAAIMIDFTHAVDWEF